MWDFAGKFSNVQNLLQDLISRKRTLIQVMNVHRTEITAVRDETAETDL